jgi:hypothetical protein
MVERTVRPLKTLPGWRQAAYCFLLLGGIAACGVGLVFRSERAAFAAGMLALCGAFFVRGSVRSGRSLPRGFIPVSLLIVLSLVQLALAVFK